MGNIYPAVSFSCQISKYPTLRKDRPKNTRVTADPYNQLIFSNIKSIYIIYARLYTFACVNCTFLHYKSVLTYFTKVYKLAEQESGVNT